MSQSNLEFLGRLDFITKIRELESRVSRLERYPNGAGDDPISIEDTTEGEVTTLRGTPSARSLNARWHGGYGINAEARPRSVLPLDNAGNVDYRKSGGI